MVEILDEKLLECLKFLLQRNVVFSINDNIFKRGKIILFNQKGFSIEILLKTKVKVIRFFLPIPFKVKLNTDNVLFSYKFCNLAYNTELLKMLYELPSSKVNRYYDNILKIEYEI